MNDSTEFYKLRISEFRPEFNFVSKGNCNNRITTIIKEPKIQFKYQKGITEDKAIFYGDVVLMLASFFHHIKIDYTLRRIHLSESTITIKNIEEKNFLNIIGDLRDFGIHCGLNKFFELSCQKETIQNFKLLSKAIALFNQSHLVDDSSAFLILLTLILGNFSAIKQKSVKRMLAYSSVVQAGYMMFALFVIDQASKDALLFYIVSYSLSSVVLFYSLTKVDSVEHKGYFGLAKRSPLLATSCTVAFFSLSGIPFTSGFLAKFFVLSAAMHVPGNLFLIIVALVLAVISVFYYFKVIVVMYFRDADSKKKLKLSMTSRLLLIFGTALNFALGTYPDLLWQFLGLFS